MGTPEFQTTIFSSEPGRRILVGWASGCTKGLAGAWRCCGWAMVCICTVEGAAAGRAGAASPRACWKNAARVEAAAPEAP